MCVSCIGMTNATLCIKHVPMTCASFHMRHNLYSMRAMTHSTCVGMTNTTLFIKHVTMTCASFHMRHNLYSMRAMTHPTYVYDVLEWQMQRYQ